MLYSEARVAMNSSSCVEQSHYEYTSKKNSLIRVLYLPIYLFCCNVFVWDIIYLLLHYAIHYSARSEHSLNRTERNIVDNSFYSSRVFYYAVRIGCGFAFGRRVEIDV